MGKNVTIKNESRNVVLRYRDAVEKAKYYKALETELKSFACETIRACGTQFSDKANGYGATIQEHGEKVPVQVQSVQGKARLDKDAYIAALENIITMCGWQLPEREVYSKLPEAYDRIDFPKAATWEKHGGYR